MRTDGKAQGAGTISLADEEAVKQVLVSTVFGLWDIVNNLTRLRLSTEPPLANPEDLAIPRCVDTADEAIALLREHHASWLQESRS